MHGCLEPPKPNPGIPAATWNALVAPFLASELLYQQLHENMSLLQIPSLQSFSSSLLAGMSQM